MKVIVTLNDNHQLTLLNVSHIKETEDQTIFIRNILGEEYKYKIPVYIDNLLAFYVSDLTINSYKIASIETYLEARIAIHEMKDKEP